ncbi:hypothetical protein [Radiobacillus sp. PE A8.2]|uniref:hypothetical protein n=1 Tax=Radiobacillus sp. PE A8.2 TaxID=3380349 RepID=UPI00388F7E60
MTIIPIQPLLWIGLITAISHFFSLHCKQQIQHVKEDHTKLSVEFKKVKTKIEKKRKRDIRNDFVSSAKDRITSRLSVNNMTLEHSVYDPDEIMRHDEQLKKMRFYHRIQPR